VSAQTVEQIRDILIDRLVSGAYPIGSRLPPVRALADEIGAHRNTVAKAYSLLAEMGLVSLRQGKGTYVTSLHNLETQVSLSSLLMDELDRLVANARRIGLAEDDLKSAFAARVTTHYAQQPRRGAMVECNMGDIQSAIDEVAETTGIRLQPLLLDDLRQDPRAATQRYGVIVTSLFHIKEVSALLEPQAAPSMLVSLYTQPDEEALRRIAAIDADAHVGIIANDVEGARRFAAQVRAYTAAETTLLLSPSQDEIFDLAARADVFVSSRSQRERLERLNLSVPIIELPFRVSQQSMAYLMERLRTPERAVA
jgi:DNA-binding transcriptional regulator YhcF (GntR family)